MADAALKRKLDETDAGPASKRKKSKKSSRDDLPAVRQRPSRLLLPPSDAPDSGKHQVDYRTTVEGIVQALSDYDEASREVHFDIEAASSASEDDQEALHITFRGEWARALLQETGLQTSNAITLSFKEAKYAHYQSESARQHSSWRLLYTRGCKLWMKQEADQSDGEEWIHYCTFAEAQAELARLDRDARGRRESTTATMDSGPEESSVKAVSRPSDQATATTSRPAAETIDDHIDAGLPEATYDYQRCAHLREAREGLLVSAMGVVVHSKPAVEKQVGFYGEIRIIDESLPPVRNDFLYVSFMSYDKEKIPLAGVGEVVVLRDFKTQQMGRRTKILARDHSEASWAVWTPQDRNSSEASANQLRAPTAFSSMTADEKMRANALLQWYQHHTKALQARPNMQYSLYPVPTPNLPAGEEVKSEKERQQSVAWAYGSRPFKLFSWIEEVHNNETDFFDCLVEVLEPLKETSDYLLAFVSDWTTNVKLPARKMPETQEISQVMFDVTIWKNSLPPGMAGTLRRALGRVGSLLCIENLKVKIAKHDGTLDTQASLVKYGFRVTEASPSDHRVKELKTRKANFYAFLNASKQVSTEHSKVGQAGLDDSGFEEADESSVIIARPASATLEEHASEHELGKVLEQAVPPSPENAVAEVPLATSHEATVPAPWRKSFGRQPRKLSTLAISEGPQDRNAFFDCFCEVMQDVYWEPGMELAILHVTDFSTNALLSANDIDDYPNGAKIKFSLAAFAEERQQQIKDLKKGQRVFLRNVRVKYSGYELEGDIGARGNFAVFPLPEDDPAHKELDRARDDLLASVALVDDAEDEDTTEVERPSATCPHVRCSAVEEPVQTNAFMTARTIEGNGLFRLRGRVVDIHPRESAQWLVSQCSICRKRSTSDSCEMCGTAIDQKTSSSEWRLSLLVELEPNGCNIEKDSIDQSKCQWVIVAPIYTDFTDGVEPIRDNVVEMQTMLATITSSPCAVNGTNPIFDFQVRLHKQAGQPATATMVETFLTRSIDV